MQLQLNGKEKTNLTQLTQPAPHEIAQESQNNPKACLAATRYLLHKTLHKHLEEEYIAKYTKAETKMLKREVKSVSFSIDHS